MMLAMNGISASILLTIAIYSGEAQLFVNFVIKHPIVIKHILLLALAGGLGQGFIFYMVIEFGVLPCSIVTTARKFFTILFSVSFFENSLQMHQWYGAVLVFGGLFSDILFTKEMSSLEVSEEEKNYAEKRPINQTVNGLIEAKAYKITEDSFVEIPVL